MHPSLQAFIESHCVCHESAIVPVVEFAREFRSEFPTWTKSQILAELVRAGFSIGLRNGVLNVAGLTLKHSWVVVDGRLLQSA